MASISTEWRDGVPVEILHIGETRAEIHPGRGAALGRLCLQMGSSARDIASDWTSEGATNPRYRGALLLPWPNRIAGATYRFRGKDYQLAVTEPQRGHALHGLLARAPFAVLRRHVGECSCSLTLEHIHGGTDPGFPFPFRAHVTWTLERHEVSLAIDVVNTGAGSMPFGFGWHPYFSLSGPIATQHLHILADAQYAANDAMIPTVLVHGDLDVGRGEPIGERSFDTVYRLKPGTGRARTRLWQPGSGEGIELWQETGPGKLNHLCVFVPPDRQSIALEPMSCAINAFNSGDGLRVLARGRHFRAAMGVTASG